MIRLFTNILVFMLLAQLLEFIIAYHVMTKGAWRKNYTGIHNMVFMGSLFVVLLPGAIAIIIRYTHDIPFTPSVFPLWFDIIRVIIYLSLPAVILWRRYILHVVQKEEKERS